MDFQFLGSGKHSMSVDGMKKALADEKVVFLDVRTEQELRFLSFPFALNIPLNELPDRVNEVPKDKLIVPFCSSVFRGAVAYLYLSANGFEKVKCLTANTEDMALVFKPGPIAKMQSLGS